jgi:hypothetical protein
MADGGWSIEFLEGNAFTAIRPVGADGKKSEADQQLARAGWRRFSLAVQIPSGLPGFDQVFACHNYAIFCV